MLPEINLFGMHIPSYFFVISLTLMASLSLLFYFIQTEAFDKLSSLGFNSSHAFDLAIVILISGFVGGRLFHVAYELPEYYMQNPIQIIQFWMGGFVYYGGMLLALLCSWIWIYWKLRQQERAGHFAIAFRYWGDLFAPSLSMGYMFGRIGCLLEGCCFGRFSALPWAIDLRHPTPLYASITEFFIFVLLLRLIRKPNPHLKPGSLFLIWLFLHSCARIFMELFRDDFRGMRFFGMSISTAISVVLMSIAFSAFWRLNRHLRKLN